jgi:hypothetical protein
MPVNFGNSVKIVKVLTLKKITPISFITHAQLITHN